jgi:alkanesulfonate monooxygenase SsuD/methylene tetrahydromethanopterin reductase-like flavin-dependent oxidoreductase (luciferase family)
MSPTECHMVLGAAQWWPGGDHITAWRRPGAQPEAFLDLEYYVDWARTAERGTFDTSFLADELYPPRCPPPTATQGPAARSRPASRST